MSTERMTQEFARLVAIDSPSYGERQVADYLKERLLGLGFSVEEDDAGEKMGGNCGNLLARRSGSLPGEPLLFSMHMDTVDPAMGKRAVFHEDGRITGAGDTVLGADDLAAVAALLEALTRAQEEERPVRDLELLFTIAEERHLMGSRAFAFEKLRARQSYVPDLSGPVGTAALKAPSLAVFTVTIHGRAAHAGFSPELGIHAVQIAARGVAKLKLGHADADTTVNVGSIRADFATNVVPDTCVLQGEVRSLKHESLEAEIGKIRELFAKEAEEAGGSAQFREELLFRAYETPEAHPVVRRYQRACAAANVPCVLSKTLGGSDQHRLSEHGITGVVLASAMHRAHSLQEYTTGEEMEQVAKILEALISDPE